MAYDISVRTSQSCLAAFSRDFYFTAWREVAMAYDMEVSTSHE